MKKNKITVALISAIVMLTGCKTSKHEIIIKRNVEAPKQFGDTPRPIIVENAGDDDFKITKQAANNSWIARHIYTEPQYRGTIETEPAASRLHPLPKENPAPVQTQKTNQ